MSSRNGVLSIDKPAGPTSHDVVARVRYALGTRSVGHTGTLDPFATGLLLVCIGTATRISEYLVGLPKSYRATVRLGIATETDDLEGEVVSENDGWTDLSHGDIEGALARQRGDILQAPPRYSAKKVEGVRAYVLARRGDEVEVPAVPVSIHRLEMMNYEPPLLDIEVDCSSGTYIRAIARDLGDALGVGAHLTALRRTRIGGFSVDDAISMEELTERAPVDRALLPPAAALTHLPRQTVSDVEVSLLSKGRRVPATPESIDGPSAGPIAAVNAAGELIAIAERIGDQLQPRKVFA